MNSGSMRWRGRVANWSSAADWGGFGVFAMAFGLLAYLGLEGGGFDPLIHDRVGIAVWWLLLGGVAVGAFARRRLGAPAWAALGSLGALTLWAALSLAWTESVELTFAEVALLTVYLGLLALFLLTRGADDGRALLGGLAAAVALVAGVGLLSRFEPSWFPHATETARLLGGNEERLAFPLDYWNAVGALMAIGSPALLHLAAADRSPLVRGLATAALSAVILAAFLTLSRSGIGAGLLALVLYMTLAPDRLPKLLNLALAGAGGAVLCLSVASRDALHDGLTGPVAESQGGEMLLLTIAVCVVVGAIRIGAHFLAKDRQRPSWPVVSPAVVRGGGVTALVVLLVAALAAGAPGRISDAWGEFKAGESPGEGSGRLVSAAGQNRYEYWRSALDQASTEPLTGTGGGTFELWWTRDRETGDAVLDAHSLYLQTLGELGVVGLLLLAGFLATVLAAGAIAVARADGAARSLRAAALAGCVAFCLVAAFDWMWQIPALVAPVLVLAALLLAPGARTREDDPAPFSPVARIGICLAALVAIVAIAIPLATESNLRESHERAAEGDLAGALADARDARNVEPGAAGPRLQEALVLEEAGAFGPAAAAAAAAAEREETNWRTWLVLARVEAERGRPAAAIAAYRHARSLNPQSPLFD